MEYTTEGPAFGDERDVEPPDERLKEYTYAEAMIGLRHSSNLCDAEIDRCADAIESHVAKQAAEIARLRKLIEEEILDGPIITPAYDGGWYVWGHVETSYQTIGEAVDAWLKLVAAEAAKEETT
jgi:hypothetical protein